MADNEDVICDGCQALYEDVGDRARAADVFGKVRRTDTALRCRARGAQSEAFYLVEVDSRTHDRVWVGLYTPDRWLSESIEADLMHLGDKIEELLDEELADQGFEEGPLPVEHFRDDNRMYVFRSAVAVPRAEKIEGPAMTRRVAQVLVAYEACFRPLGDMSGDEE